MVNVMQVHIQPEGRSLMLFNDTKLSGISTKIQKVAARGATLSAPATPAARLGRQSVFGSPMADATPTSPDAAISGHSNSAGVSSQSAPETLSAVALATPAISQAAVPERLPATNEKNTSDLEAAGQSQDGSSDLGPAKHEHHQDKRVAPGHLHPTIASGTQPPAATRKAEPAQPPAFGSPVPGRIDEHCSNSSVIEVGMGPALSQQPAVDPVAHHMPVASQTALE